MKLKTLEISTMSLPVKERARKMMTIREKGACGGRDDMLSPRLSWRT
jgi:hypothetical protein